MKFLTYIMEGERLANLGWTESLHSVYATEAALLVMSYLEFFILFYLFIFVRTFHINMNCLFMVYGGQYFFSMAARSVMLYFQYNQCEQDSELFRLANFVRTGCLFVAFYILPAIMIERCFATFFLVDYESSRRFWIPTLILAIFLPFVALAALFFIYEVVPVYFQVTSFFILNCIGYVGLVVNHRYNTRMHRESLVGVADRDYSLSERYQLAENIKTCKVLKTVQMSIIFFNMLCTSVLVMDQFPVGDFILYSTYLFFNFACIAYGVTVPIVLYAMTPEWQRELSRIVSLMCCRSRVAPRSLLSTQGRQMTFAAGQKETDQYFMQLKRQFEK